MGDEEEESKKVMGYYGGCVLYLCWCKSLTPTGQEMCCGGSGGVMQWVVGTDERERRAIINFRLDRQMKTLSYTTSLAPFFFFWS